MDTSKTQGKIYKMTDIRQTKEYANYLASQGWIVERIDNSNYFLKKLPIIGSVLKIQRPKKVNFETLQKLEKKHRVFQTVIEPGLTSSTVTKFFNHNSLLQHGFKLSRNPYLPSKTIHLDLTKPKEEIFRKFSKKTRYSIKRGENLTIKEYSTPKELEKFYNAWKKSINFNRFVPSLQSLLNLKKSFPNNYSTFLASHNKIGSIIGGAIFTRSSHDFGYYWFGFTNKEGRTSLSQYSLLFSGILWAKRQNCRVFDFEGIYDERFPQKSWLGFTHFKKQFGGTEVLYPGCYIKFNFPFYKTY